MTVSKTTPASPCGCGSLCTAVERVDGMGLLWNIFAVIAGVGILISEALLVFTVLAFLAQLSLGLVVLLTAAGAGYVVRDWVNLLATSKIGTV